MSHTPDLTLPYATTLGHALHHQGREYRFTKVKRRGDAWLVWLTPAPHPAGCAHTHPWR